jgi:peptide/nickel transport system ATP-binding protein
MSAPLVEVKNLRIAFPNEDGGYTPAVKGVSFALGREKLGIVGESGSGKSLSGRALLGVLPDYAQVSADAMSFDGINLLTASPRTRRQLRGGRMGMILQDPKFSLNPVMRVGMQIVEAIRVGDRRVSGKEARKRTLEMLEAVHIREPERVFGLYPHELSGGMGQRVMIAMMVVREPDLLIADEPTSALDVTVQQQVLAIMDELVTRRGMGLIFISHDLRLVSRFCDRVLVMYGGRIVEELRADQLPDAQHPYTRGLLGCLPTIDGPLTPLSVLQRDAAWASEASL